MTRFFREDEEGFFEITHDQAIELLSKNYDEKVCSFEDMLIQNVGYDIPCQFCTLHISEGNGDLISRIRGIIEESSRMKNAYFFYSPSTASARRSYEKDHSRPRVEWFDGGHTYSAEFIVSCSCKHVYAKAQYTKDGAKTNATAIRNSLNRLT